MKRSRGKGRICLFNQGREALRFSRVYFHKIKGGIINYDYNEDTFSNIFFLAEAQISQNSIKSMEVPYYPRQLINIVMLM